MLTKADIRILKIPIPDGAAPGPRVQQAERKLVEHIRGGLPKPSFIPEYDWHQWITEAKQLFDDYPEDNWGGTRQGAGRPPINFKIPGLSTEIARWFGDLRDSERANIIREYYRQIGA
jgi:hypothetical protein